MSKPNDGLYVNVGLAARLAGYSEPAKFLAAIACDANAPRALKGDLLSGPTFNRAEVVAWSETRSRTND